jgi:competence protein ComEC
MCLLRSPLRWSGLALVALCIVMAWSTPRPDILVSADAGMVAVRDADGALRVIASRRDAFVLREWLAADGDARTDKDESLGHGTRCDQAGCVARLPDGRAVTLSVAADAMVEDCEIAALVVTPRMAPPSCASSIVDRNAVRQEGAVSARWNGQAFVLDRARPRIHERPWTPVRTTAAPAPARPQQPRSATPAPMDLEAEDGPSVTPE